MGKKPNRASPGLREGVAAFGVQTDEQILKDRQRVEAFEAADGVLRAVSWGLWVLAAAWFFLFTPAVPTVGFLHGGLGDPVVALLACGTFCGNLSRASPKATWSGWRWSWQLVWAVVFAMLGALFANVRREAKRLEPGKLVPAGGFWIGISCGVGAAALVLSLPRARSSPGKGANVLVGRLLCMLDSLLGFFIGGGIAYEGPWSAPFGSLAIAASVLPLLMLCLGLFASRTEAELLGAVPAAMVLVAGTAIKTLFLEGPALGLPIVGVLVVHACLYLPLPPKEYELNPFFMVICRSARRFQKMLSDPVSGFGDDD